MSNKKMKELISKRLAVWGAGCLAYQATPEILIGVGHNENKGHIVTCAPTHLTVKQCVGLLELAAAKLRATELEYLPSFFELPPPAGSRLGTEPPGVEPH